MHLSGLPSGKIVTVKNEVLAPVDEAVGDSFDLDGSTVGELAKDLYCNHTNYADLVDIFPS